MIPREKLGIKDGLINPLPFPYQDAQRFQRALPSIQIPDNTLSAPSYTHSHYPIPKLLTSVT